MKLSIIAAMSSNGAIGRGNALPWRLRPDLQRFRRLTMGRALIVGRRTFESIGRALPGRTMIVMTRREDFAPEGAEVARSLDEALGLATRPGECAEVFVAGGAMVYAEAILRADRLYLTLIEGDYEADAFFPPVEWSRWRLAEEESHPAGPGQPAFRFVTYERIDGSGEGGAS